MPVSVRSLAIASRMKAIEIVNSSASTLRGRASRSWRDCRSGCGPSEPSGVRSRNSAPWANSMKIAGQRETSASCGPPEFERGRPGVGGDDAGAEQDAQLDGVDEGVQAASQEPDRAPASASAGSGLRRSKTRAPHQVSAKEPNNTALARSIDSESGTVPYSPSSMIEMRA